MKLKIASAILSILSIIIISLFAIESHEKDPDTLTLKSYHEEIEKARFVAFKQNKISIPPTPNDDDDEDLSGYSHEAYGWSFKRMNDHKPSESYAAFDISPFDAYYRNEHVKPGDKVIYLTFDCGYEYKHLTKTILDILKDKCVNATFFVTKQFIKTDYELCIRMKDEGHIIGNHTMNHPNLAKVDDERFIQEVQGLDDYLYERTTYHIDSFLRPPEGGYSEYSLAKTKELGYTTIFWSIAYLDYDTENQPGADYVLEHIKKYHHNGAIILMHAISESNVEALPDVIDYLLSEGYRFGILTEFK